MYTQANPRHPIQERSFHRIFETRFNISFGRPYTDTCKTCDLFATQLKLEESEDRKAELEGQRSAHQQSASDGFRAMKEDMLISELFGQQDGEITSEGSESEEEL